MDDKDEIEYESIGLQLNIFEASSLLVLMSQGIAGYTNSILELQRIDKEGAPEEAGFKNKEEVTEMIQYQQVILGNAKKLKKEIATIVIELDGTEDMVAESKKIKKPEWASKGKSES